MTENSILIPIKAPITEKGPATSFLNSGPGANPYGLASSSKRTLTQSGKRFDFLDDYVPSSWLVAWNYV